MVNTEEFIRQYGVAAYEKKLQQSRDWREAHLEQVKANRRAQYAAYPEQDKVAAKAWYDVHSEQVLVKKKVWRKAHPVDVKANDKAYRENHSEQVKAATKAWCKNHREQVNANQRECGAKYDKSEKGKAAIKKKNAKRRALGFIPLNDYFEGSEGHHLNHDFVVYIPKKIHQSISHSATQNRNMDEINVLALDFLYRGVG